MAQGSFAYIQFIDRPGRPGGPVDPGWGVDEGGHPDQGLPGGGRPPRPGHLPAWGGRPIDPGFGWGGGAEHPDQGLPGGGRPIDPGFGWGGGERPGHGLPRPPHLWPRPPGGGLPVDPGWGVGEGGEHPDQGPVHPMDPAHPDNTLPPVEGIEPPPVDPPPGTIWPPLPPDVEVTGKAIVLAAIQGVGYRYIVVDIAPRPDQGLPGVPGGAEPKAGGGRRAR